MAEISGSSWSETDASNSSPAPNGFPEGMPFSGVNDSARAVMGAVKRFWGRINGRYASTGSSNAYVLTPDVALSAYVTGERYSFRANFANTGAATLNISSLGAKAIKKMTASGKADLAPGDIQQGQSVTVEYDGTDMVMVTPVAPRTIAAGAGLAGGGDLSADRTLSVIVPLGQCRLTLDTDSGNLVLSRCDGKYLFIGSANHEIPQAGVTLPPTGLTPDTTYNIYAYMDSGTMKLEASTTPPDDDSTYGHKIKTGDATRTLVGMARVVAGPAWVDTNTQRFVLSYYNRRNIALLNALTESHVSTTSTSYVELDSDLRVEFLTWGDEAVDISVTGQCNNEQANAVSYTSIGIDSATAEDTFSVVQAFTGGGSGAVACALKKSGLAEGYHYATVLVKVTSSTTGNWFGGSTPGQRLSITAMIRG